MVKTKQEQELSNGVMISTTKEGWNKENVASQPVLFSGWAPSSAPHFSISKGMGMAILKHKDGDIEELKEIYLGDFEGIPVLDPVRIMELIRNTAIDKYNLEVEKVRIAGDRTGARKELNAIGSMAAQMSPEQLEQLKAISPEMYEKMVKLSGN